MSTLKTHNLQSPDASSANIALAPNAGMVVAGLSTYSNQINVGSNIKIGNAGVVTATSFSGDGSNLTGLVSVANQANNRLITATSTTDALYGESTLTYDGQYLVQNVTNGKIISGNDNLSTISSQALHLRHSNLNSQYIRNETTKSDHAFLALSLKSPNNDLQIWNQGSGGSGYGGANSINFYQSGSSYGPYGFYFGTTQALRINTNGNIVMGNSTTSTTRLDIRFTDTTTYSASSNHPNGLKIFNDCATDNGFAGIELAATDGNDYYGSTLLKSIADGTNYTNDFVIQTRIGGNYAERIRIASNGQVSISSDGTTDGLLTIKGNSDATGTPSIRLLDGSDTREVSISNQSGDLIMSTHGTDNAEHGSLKVYDSGIIAFSTNSGAGNAERLRVDLNGGVRHMGTAGYWQITVIHNGSGSGNWYSGSAPQQIYPNYIDNRTGYAEFLIEFNPSISYSGYSEPTFVICGGDGGLKTGGTIELNMNRRTNSPSNGTFRSYHGQFSWQIYNDGDTDAVAGQREINRNVEHRSSSYIAASTQSVDYIANNDGRYGTNVEPIIDQRSYIKIKMNKVGSHTAIQGHPFICRFVTYSQGDKNWFAYMQYN